MAAGDEVAPVPRLLKVSLGVEFSNNVHMSRKGEAGYQEFSVIHGYTARSRLPGMRPCLKTSFWQ